MLTETTPGIDIGGERIRTIKDVGVLLEFLGQQADSRLQAHFEDTRGDLSAPIRKLAVPPCRTYRHFLNRLVSIGGPLAGLAVDSAMVPAQPNSQPEGDEGLGDLAFLYFSRDFLAAVAAPATVDTICVTRAYRMGRRYSLLSRLCSALRKRDAGARNATPPDGGNECAAGGKRLAFRVIAIEYGAILLTLLTLTISAYALAGRMILDSQRQILADYAAIGHDMEELAKDMSRAAGAPMQSAAASGKTVPLQTDPAHFTVISLRQCSLYWRNKHAAEDIAAVTLHLVSWTRVVIGMPNIGTVFGVSQAFIRESADMHGELCKRLGFEIDADGHCGPQLQDLIYHTREVADSLLGCIALYVLPALYGCLGAAAATLRTLRRKVDLSLVTATDRGRVQQDIILGLLCGAIIGLFVGYVGKATPGDGLGLSALALLGGYNVSGVFAFLDGLSNRVFQPAQASHSDSRPG